MRKLPNISMVTKTPLLVFLHVALLFTPILGCSNANWWTSFDQAGFSTCTSSTQYINGLWRNGHSKNNDGINLIEEARCCARTRPFYNMPTNCQIADWVGSFDQNNRWNNCPQGFFLQGLYRSNDKWLHNIEYGKCCKPANHPYYYGHCYDQNVLLSFDNKGLSKCNDGYFMIGLYRSSCDKLYCIEKFKCCKMYHNSPTLEKLSDVKTRVMDLTLHDIAYLSHYLGYGWSAGCRAQYVGEDFRRTGDSWEADRKGPCNGYKADHRLKIHYRDFKFGIKDIKYGTPIIQSMTPEVYLSGRVSNADNTPVTHTVERVVTSTRTVTHTKTSSWKNSHELGVEFSYTPPGATGGAGGKVSYKFNYESSQTTTDSTAKQQQSKISVKSQKTLDPHSAATYKIMLTRTRTTMPYTATIIAHFSAEMDGFLRWGGGYHGDSTNYHYQHRGSGKRPTFKYKFGDGNTPFYKALRRESDQGLRPWLWSDMKSRWTYAQSVINSLTNEGWYEFQLKGQFEDVIGQHADIQWKTGSLKKRHVGTFHKNSPDVQNSDPPRVFPDPPKVEIITPSVEQSDHVEYIKGN